MTKKKYTCRVDVVVDGMCVCVSVCVLSACFGQQAMGLHRHELDSSSSRAQQISSRRTQSEVGKVHSPNRLSLCVAVVVCACVIFQFAWIDSKTVIVGYYLRAIKIDGESDPFGCLTDGEL